MKYEPKIYLQKSSDWYERNRMSWHGTVVTYWAKEESAEGAGDVENRGDGISAPKNLYQDHVCRNDTNQTAFAVVSIAELVCRLIDQDLQAAKTAVMHIGNA